MKKLLIFLTIVSLNLTSSPSYCDQDVTFLPKGTPTPYEGFLFSKDKALETRKSLIEYENDKPLLDSYQKSVLNLKEQTNLQQNEIDILLKQNKTLLDETTGHQTLTIVENVGCFILGAVIMYGAVRVGKEATK